MALGLIQAGLDVKFAFDINEIAIETYRNNISDHCKVLDASKVEGKALLEYGGLGEERVDILTGGPPCQGFSKQKRGAHLLHDKRNSLVLDFARLVHETKARGFIFENVEIFGQKRGKELIEDIKDFLGDYDIYTFFICSSKFGLAQKRGRFLMIGIHGTENAPPPVLEVKKDRVTIADVIGDLPPPPDDCSEHLNYPNHIKCRITKLNEERFSYVPQGGGWKDIPWHLRLKCHQTVNVNQGGWPDVYGRLSWDGQCPTITAGFDSFTRGRYGHPEQNRSLTLREGARLQGFPDHFRFFGTRHDVRLQIGNAVPPPVARAAGEALSRSLRGEMRRPDRFILPEETFEQRKLAI